MPVQEDVENLGLKALERIAKHEKECGERWAEASAELRALRNATDNHALRWEKLAWLIVTVVVTTSAALLATHTG